jgi:hypothetical protein
MLNSRRGRSRRGRGRTSRSIRIWRLRSSKRKMTVSLLRGKSRKTSRDSRERRNSSRERLRS